MIRKGHKTLKYQKVQPGKHILHFSTIWLNNGFPPNPTASRWRRQWTRYL